MDPADVTIAFCSGRRRLVAVVDMLAGRLRALRWAERLRLRLVVVWDRTLEGQAAPRHELRGAAAGLFAEVLWLDPDRWRDHAPAAALAAATVCRMLRRPGYAARRTLALLDAAQAGSRFLLFLDDDEYFTAPWRAGDGRIHWRAVDPLGPHLAGLAAGAAITNGLVLGQPSPIPRGLRQRVPERLLEALGAALAAGSEFIGPATFLSGRLCLAPPSKVCGPHPIRPVGGVFPLTGGNLALDLGAVRDGRIPAFFAPPHARGEDALLGARAAHLPLLRVPAYTFHDPFGLHVDVAGGARPCQLDPAPLTAPSVERFGRAFLGWLRYAPLLLRLRAGAQRSVYRDGIEAMGAAIARAAPVLASRLQWEGFATAPEVLERFHRRSARDLADLRVVDAAWASVVSALDGRALDGRALAQRAA